MAGDKGKKRSRTDMKGNNVEDGDSNEYQSAQKKSKDKKDVDLGHGNGDQSEIMKSKSQPLLCVGTSCNLSDRKKNILHCLSKLFPGLKGKVEIETTDNWSKLFQDENCPFGLYMERVEDLFFIWASSRSKGVEIKLELLTAFGTDSDELDVKNPLLAFSHGFEDGDMWQNLKQFLLEVGSSSYAFTRSSPCQIHCKGVIYN